MLTIFRRNPQAPTIEALYGAIVAQARAPVFYRDLGVADTVNGRLDLLMLHLGLAFDRLSRGEEPAKAAGQAAFDRFCQDMDDHLRQDGISDLRVPKDMRRLAAAFFGRQRAYISALKAGDRDALRSALCRNVYADEDRPGLDGLTAYVEAAARGLDGQDATAIASGRIAWPDPVPQAGGLP
jgi:cytochrome b pre-mRNA-processing protein 3